MPRKAANSRFASVLTNIIAESFDGNGTALARACGLGSSLIAYYTRPGATGRFPSQTQLERLLTPLSEEQQRRLIAAYLQDHIPTSHAHLIRISGAKEAPTPKRPLGRDAEAVLDAIREAAAKDNAAKVWLLATGRAFFGKR